MQKNWTYFRNKAVIILLTLVILFSIPNLSRAITTIEQQYEIIQEVYRVISDYHINNVEPEVLTQGAIDGMIEALEDPYTTYYTEEEFLSFLNDIDGTFTGIGIYIEEKDGYIVVQTPIPGSPADQAGLKAGDAIIGVDGTDMVGRKLEEAVNLIRGKEGTTVTLTIKRDEEILTKEIVRAKISLPVIESEMLSDEIGYLRLYSFSSQSAQEFKNHLEQLKKDGMKSFILDLRSNPGGYLDAVLEISKNFIKDGPIVYIKNKDQQENVLSVAGGTNWDLPTVVLIDGGSASASEILAGALKDYNKASIIGEKSFGKGTVQNLVQLETGGYLKITINEYFTPDKHKMDGVGVAPDIEIKEPEKQLPNALLTLTKSPVYRPVLGSDWFKESDNDYLSLRKLIESLGGTISWNSKLRAVEVQLGGKTAQFTVNDTLGFTMKNGKTYITVDELKKNFEDMIIIQEEETLMIFMP